tara:strand:- start:9022 stop:10362 length:1341 start_codon:yes stop_codon:yes gene_type:complete
MPLLTTLASCSVRGFGFGSLADDSFSFDGTLAVPNWNSGTITQRKLIQSDASGGQFGRPVTLSYDGNYFVGGSAASNNTPSNAGKAYVFLKTGAAPSSTYPQQAILQHDTPSADDAFSYDYDTIDINSDGTYFIGGARTEDPVGAFNGGKAYIFTRSGTSWSQQATLESSDIQGNDQFGIGVAINGDGTIAAVSATGEDGGAGDPLASSGAVYIYTRSGSTWSEQTILRASNAGASDSFGARIDMDEAGEYLLVSAHVEDGPTDSTSNVGCAYVFKRTGSSWAEQAILRPSDPAASMFFGRGAINSEGNICAIPSDRVDSFRGAVYVFTRSGSEWTQQAKIAGPGGFDTFFGGAVAINEGNIIAARAAKTSTGLTSDGVIYVYQVTDPTNPQSSWTLKKTFQSSDIADGDNFGFSIEISKDGSVIGAGAISEGTNGSCYTFEVPFV